MTKRTLTFALLLSLSFSGSVFAACDAPEDPAIPSGDGASGADMLKAKKAVEGYVEAAEAYMGCGVAAALQDRMSARMSKVVDRFNKELRAYKSKS